MALERKIIETKQAPAVAPFLSQAVSFNNLIYLSGSLGVNPDTNKFVDGGVGPETKQALENIKNILEAGKSSIENIVKATVYLKDIKDYGVMNDVYKQYFTKNPPARTAFQVGNLPHNASVEIEVVAAVGNLKTSHSKL
ncbi:unnamed protein product [Psylliodes chrysocephalus]|uniref:Uncharacterized protein n=1 Tax=Psylliodes chrysocephalus TaxID=3402493 RepID=A0A9P0DBM2_9CUCU|nr:unnamed protein product [Psylliodes chrysocephala]